MGCGLQAIFAVGKVPEGYLDAFTKPSIDGMVHLGCTGKDIRLTIEYDSDLPYYHLNCHDNECAKK
jgi:hypothetical protein